MKEHLKEYIDKGLSYDVRGLRILLEYFYAAEKFAPIQKANIPIISVFGSARVSEDSSAYKQARKLGEELYKAGYAVVTGASSGVMEAANRGVADSIAKESKNRARSADAVRKIPRYKNKLKRYSLGLRISLPSEEKENIWVGSAALFHYFMIRKFYFATLSAGFIVCEGGWGTHDELYEILALVQTGKSPLMPIVYLSKKPDHLKQELIRMADSNYIKKDDLDLVNIAKKPADAVRIIRNFYRRVESIRYKRRDVQITLKDQPARKLKGELDYLMQEYSGFFESYVWKGRSIELRGFIGKSYGTLRKLVDHINGLDAKK